MADCQPTALRAGRVLGCSWPMLSALGAIETEAPSKAAVVAGGTGSGRIPRKLSRQRRSAASVHPAPPLTAGRTIASFASSPAVRKRMQQVRRRDTAEELMLRSLLHERGLRYRVDARPLPDFRRRADIVFPRAQLAVFVDGCFWHGCREHRSRLRTNAPWWRTKLAANSRRDRDTNRRLSEAGWEVVRFWEHDDLRRASTVVERLVRRRLDRKVSP